MRRWQSAPQYVFGKLSALGGLAASSDTVQQACSRLHYERLGLPLNHWQTIFDLRF
jgi:hypothetical protein